MEHVESNFMKILVIGLCLSIIEASILLIYKINFKEASILSFIFAFIFLIAFFFQPFLVTLDYAIFIYDSYNLRERNYENIDKILYLSYKIIGWIGIFFSLAFLPIFKYYYFSGYFTFYRKLGHSLRRYFCGDLIKYYILAIPGLILILFALYLYYISGKQDLVLNSKDLLFNCLSIPGQIKCLIYIGSYFPILFSELKFSFRNEKYKKILNGIITQSIQDDIKNMDEAYIKILNTEIEKVFKDNSQKNEIERIKKEYEKNKESCHIQIKKVNNNENGEEINDDKFEKVVSLKTAEKIVCESMTVIKETLLILPRKFFVRKNIEDKMDKEHGNYYFLYPLFMLVIGASVLFIELFGDSINYSEYTDQYDRIKSNNCFYLFIILYIYHIAIYFCVLKRNSITNHMLYGKRNSDTLCLLNFATEISGLITPIPFFVIYSNLFGIHYYDEKFGNSGKKEYYPQNNMVFTKLNKYILVDNIKPLFNLDITFKDTFWIFVFIKDCIIIFFLLSTFLFYSLTLKFCCYCCCNTKCCHKGCNTKKFKYIFNDKNEKFCACCRDITFESKGDRDSLRLLELVTQL